MTLPELEYTGLEILEALQEATNYNRYLTDLVEQASGSFRVALDFGAGIGTFSALVRDRGFTVQCLETDSYLASRLCAAGFETVSDVIEIADASLEYVFTLNVFEHIAEDRTVLTSLAQKIRPGGRLMIFVPAFQFLWSSLDDRVQHHRRYTTKSLQNLVTSAGLSVEECRYADSLGYLAALVYKARRNKSGNVSIAAITKYDRLVVPISRRLDYVVGGIFGKNVYAVCTKPSA